MLLQQWVGQERDWARPPGNGKRPQQVPDASGCLSIHLPPRKQRQKQSQKAESYPLQKIESLGKEYFLLKHASPTCLLPTQTPLLIFFSFFWPSVLTARSPVIYHPVALFFLATNLHVLFLFLALVLSLSLSLTYTERDPRTYSFHTHLCKWRHRLTLTRPPFPHFVVLAML